MSLTLRLLCHLDQLIDKLASEQGCRQIEFYISHRIAHIGQLRNGGYLELQLLRIGVWSHLHTPLNQQEVILEHSRAEHLVILAEETEFARAVVVHNNHRACWRTILEVKFACVGYDTRHRNLLATILFEVGKVGKRTTT